MQLKVKEFNQVNYEESIARVLPILNLEDKRAVRDALIQVIDSIDNAIAIQKRLDLINLEKLNETKVKPKPKEEPVAEEVDYEIDEEEDPFVGKRK